ncbi:MAG: DNA recombination protein RmuC [Arachnia sp.]
MTTTGILISIVSLVLGAAIGYAVGRRLAAQGVAARQAQSTADARIDAATARAEASRAREEMARARAEAAQQETAAATLRTSIAEAQRRIAEAQADTSAVGARLAAAEVERDAALQRVADLSADRESLVAQFKQLSDETLERQGQKAEKSATERLAATQQLVTPLADGLRQLNDRLTEVEKERTRLAAELGEQVKAVRQSGETLRKETMSLSNALRTPQVRGSWGEQSLRRIVEISGLTERCDFDDQQTYTDSEGEKRYRPDMRINLADGHVVFVDSKVPLAAVLDAYNTEDDAEQRAHLAKFAKHVRKHIDDLSGKNYWQLDQGSPEFVVLFLGSDEFYRLALEHMPDLYDYANRRNVSLASPGTLIPMLQIVAHGWKQVGLAESAAKVSKLGRELHERLATLGEHFDKLGRSVANTVKHYNGAIGALESRVMVSARRFTELGVVDSQIPTLSRVDQVPREQAVPELLDHAALGKVEATRSELELFDREADELPEPRTLPAKRTGTAH